MHILVGGNARDSSKLNAGRLREFIVAQYPADANAQYRHHRVLEAPEYTGGSYIGCITNPAIYIQVIPEHGIVWADISSRDPETNFSLFFDVLQRDFGLCDIIYKVLDDNLECQEPKPQRK